MGPVGLEPTTSRSLPGVLSAGRSTKLSYGPNNNIITNLFKTFVKILMRMMNDGRLEMVMKNKFTENSFFM